VLGENFADAALVLIGHGSTVNAESAATVYQQAAELRRRKQFAEVREAFWKQEPRLNTVASEPSAARIFFAPFFISEGYFSEEVIPKELGFRAEGQGEFARVLRRGGQSLFYCRPIGTHPSMTGVLLARARGIVEKFPFPRAPKSAETTLFIVGHGTEQNEDSRKSVERQAESIRTRGLYASVQAVFLEEDPRIGECYARAQTRNVVVVPFFMSDGLHVQEDIPALLGEPKRILQQRREKGQPPWRNPTERKDKLVWYAESIGSEPQIAEVILERVREAARAA
jgi:sirohydrochlorin cobaltochelatase